MAKKRPVKRKNRAGQNKGNLFSVLALTPKLKMKMLGTGMAIAGAIIGFFSRSVTTIMRPKPLSTADMLSRMMRPIEYETVSVITYSWQLAGIALILIGIGIGIIALSLKKSKK